jgi:4-amino-4-deoxy-L-arabinose transferase-like glycosyltransferase
MHEVLRRTVFFLKSNVVLITIFVIASLIRIAKLKFAFYGTANELARDLSVVYDLIVFHEIPLLGPSASLGNFYFGAFYYYLLAPFVYIGNFMPSYAVAVSGTFSVLGIVVLYKLLSFWGDKKLGLIAAGIAAVNLFDIQNSYYVSNPNLLPFFTLAFFLLLTLMLSKEFNFGRAVLAGLCLGIAMQLHATALFILPLTTIIILFLFKNRVSYALTFLLFFAAAATYVPYFIYEVQNGYVNTFSIINHGGNNLSLVPNLKGLSALLVFLISVLLHQNDFFSLIEYSNFAYFGLALLFAIFGIILLVKTRKQEEFKTAAFSDIGKKIIAVWFIVSALTFLFFQNNIPLFYFLVLWPLPVIGLAWFGYWICLNWPKLGLLLLVLYLTAQAAQIIFFYQIVEKKRICL